MSCEIRPEPYGKPGVVFYCNTSEVYFGDTFKSEEEAERFQSWLKVDPRSLNTGALRIKRSEWDCYRGITP